MFKIYYENLEKIIPNAIYGPRSWCTELNDLLPKYKIDTFEKVAAFLAQTSYESLGYTVLKENASYSASTLKGLWPRLFNDSNASAYAGHADFITNRIYANRMGNKGEESGDGYKYRGRGLIHITGKDNYTKFAQHAGMAADESLEYIQTPHGAVHAACWIWKSCDLNLYAEREDIIGISNRLTKGMIGVEAKETNFKKIKEILC